MFEHRFASPKSQANRKLTHAGIAVVAATGSATVLNFTSPKNTAKFSRANTHDL